MSLKQPVRYPVKYYSHLDAGAPQLADIDGNIKTILKAGLVTGIGTKAGAGWTALFEDDFRIVLRRPLRTGNPPDIKIENGVINGVASHRIVSQDNSTGLDDTNELAAVNLLARDVRHGQEWHLVVSDFGFMLCYQMGEANESGDRNHAWYCGGSNSVDDSVGEQFVSSVAGNVSQTGSAGNWMTGILDPYGSYFINMRSNVTVGTAQILSIDVAEKYYGDAYLAQSILINAGFIIPFYAATPSQLNDKLTSTIIIDGRPMLRFANKNIQNRTPRPLYIPLDYWEL